MKKSFILLICALNLINSLESMEKNLLASEEDQSESLWTMLPVEIQQMLLSYAVGLDKATCFEQIIAILKSLGRSSLFSNLVNDKDFIERLAKIYIQKNKKPALSDFHSFIMTKKIFLIRAFINAGIDVNAKSSQLRDLFTGNFLMYAAMNSKRDIIKILLEAGADVELGYDWGYTPLMGAAEYNNLEAVQLLLDYGADINAQHVDKLTALMLAAKKASKEIVELLLNKGADANIRDVYGRTALKIANRLDRKEIVEIFKQTA